MAASPATPKAQCTPEHAVLSMAGAVIPPNTAALAAHRAAPRLLRPLQRQQRQERKSRC